MREGIDDDAVPEVRSGVRGEAAAASNPGVADFEDEEDELGAAADFLRSIARAPEIAPHTVANRRKLGDRIGRFRLLEKLGEGGMGVVYAAEDEKLRRTVALKLLHEDEVADHERRRRFVREARSASAVSHSNIAAIYEVGEVDGAVFIAMERIRGVSLRERLVTRPLAIEEAVRIGTEIAWALASAHGAGVVHRDLKPDNVMLAEANGASNGATQLVKVLDFGLAKLVGDRFGEAPGAHASTSELVTQEGKILGTPSYMSPEQATGRATDARSDIFSLGIVLYEMVVGARPFVGTTAMEVLVSISRDRAPRASRRNRRVTPRLDRLIARCLEKDSANRPPTCEDIAQELEAIARARSLRPRRMLRLLGCAAAVLVIGVGLRFGSVSVASPAGEASPGTGQAPMPPPPAQVSTGAVELSPESTTALPTHDLAPPAPPTAAPASSAGANPPRPLLRLKSKGPPRASAQPGSSDPLGDQK